MEPRFSSRQGSPSAWAAMAGAAGKAPAERKGGLIARWTRGDLSQITATTAKKIPRFEHRAAQQRIDLGGVRSVKDHSGVNDQRETFHKRIGRIPVQGLSDVDVLSYPLPVDGA